MTFIIPHVLISRLCVSEIIIQLLFKLLNYYFNCVKFNLFNKYLLNTYYVSGILRSKISFVSCQKKKVQRFQSISNSEAQILW